MIILSSSQPLKVIQGDLNEIFLKEYGENAMTSFENAVIKSIKNRQERENKDGEKPVNLDSEEPPCHLKGAQKFLKCHSECCFDFATENILLTEHECEVEKKKSQSIHKKPSSSDKT